jgi:hypothetical protein
MGNNYNIIPVVERILVGRLQQQNKPGTHSKNEKHEL